ncbi:MAG TPA: hypothetical protein VFU41_11005 [Gemmatimonadales bacterium]|nr:hypothetical protein [Gemmatimonadales bacterium]
MRPSNLRPALAGLATLLASCGSSPNDRSALDAVTSAAMGIPITTTSAAARSHFLQGQRDTDLGRFIEGNAHFEQAIAADPSFAFGYLNVANTANSLEEFKTHLALAERHAEGASEAERLLIQMTRKGFDNDLEGQLALGRQLVEQQPESPRAWLALGAVQQSMNRNADARASMMKALELTPRMFVAHTDLGNSYLFVEPRDFAKALEHMQQAEKLAPNEPWPHDLLGDVYRALNNLQSARREYTRAHELSPKDASPLQQRGHVNSFLGDYAAARADYDSAITLGRANERGAFGIWRAFVSVYAGDPQAAIAELNQLVVAIDGMTIPEPRGVKTNALTNAAVIAIHTRDFPAAEQALKRRSALMREATAAVGTAPFQRAQDANIAYFDAWLAARKGDYATARRLADRVAQLVEPDASPRKMEPVHQIKGFVALYQGNYGEAVGHFKQGNLLDIYIKHQLALAHEGAGNTAEAKNLFREVASNNFNNVGFGLVRKEAAQKGA